jgi:hypothetical protein
VFVEFTDNIGVSLETLSRYEGYLKEEAHKLCITVSCNMNNTSAKLLDAIFFFIEDPIYLQSVIIPSANGGKLLRMSCRRALNSTPLLVRGSETV